MVVPPRHQDSKDKKIKNVRLYRFGIFISSSSLVLILIFGLRGPVEGVWLSALGIVVGLLIGLSQEKGGTVTPMHGDVMYSDSPKDDDVEH